MQEIRKAAVNMVRAAVIYPQIESVTSPTVSTDQAAYYLNRKSQTLRTWACLENGALVPVKINGRLAWSVSEIKALTMGVK
ncbi:MAG: hypothetical protein QX198_15580 [Methylococcaceae bacterium]